MGTTIVPQAGVQTTVGLGAVVDAEAEASVLAAALGCDATPATAITSASITVARNALTRHSTSFRAHQ
jgi:hypothetical protein